ncbi:MAG: hypothetical protein E4H28_07925 [Gemmatimonadales bacterium]|nr:MAG: hypothetical protein E4H28_07925 [Gemmatimonadales bacterium]
MNKVLLLMGMIVLLSAPGAALAEEESPKLGVTVDSTFVTKYMWRGYSILGSHAAWQPSVDLDLFDTGFSFNVWYSKAMSKGLSDFDEIDYTLAYGTTLFDGKSFAIDAGANYIYYDFPNLKNIADTEEVGLSLAMPSLLPLGSSYLVPSYYVGRLYPAKEGGPKGGLFHVLGLSYDLPIGGDRALNLCADVTYNTGAFDAPPGWSHATFGVSTDIETKLGLTVTPSLNYQATFEDAVHDSDEVWAGMSVSYSF